MSEDNIAQMRETIERLSKDKAGLEKQVTDQGSQLRVYEAQDAFREQGYRPANGKLFASLNPEGDITAEAVVTFAEEQGFAPVESNQEAGESKQESVSEKAEGQADLSKMAGSGSRAGDGGAGGANPESLTRQEWQELHANDPEAARAAVASGRVQVSKTNPSMGGKNAPGVNPFAAFTQPSGE